MNKNVLIAIGAAAVLLLLFIFAVGTNHKLENSILEQEYAYQDSLRVYEDQLKESAKLIEEWAAAYDSLDVVNLEIDQRQLDIKNDASNKRKKRYEELVSIKRWSDDERDQFWTTESSVQDTIIPFPN